MQPQILIQLVIQVNPNIRNEIYVDAKNDRLKVPTATIILIFILLLFTLNTKTIQPHWN